MCQSVCEVLSYPIPPPTMVGDSGKLRHGTLIFVLDTHIFIKINNMYGNLKDQNLMKLDLCIREALSYTHGTIATNINYVMSSKAEKKTTFAPYKTCYTNWIVMRLYTHYRSTTNSKLTFFQKVLVFSDGKQYFKPCPIVLFAACSSVPPQTVLTRTVGSREYKGHLQLKCSIAEWHIKSTLLFPMYSLQAKELIHGDMTTI